MNVLSIGNSFSQDAHRYLHGIAKADGFELNAFNLYIGGCPLSLHYRNMLSEARAYALEMNGQTTGFNVSIKEALLSRDWDVVTLQQASPVSPDYKTYVPFANKLAEYIRLCVPKTRLIIHQTWAYEQDSQRLCQMLGYRKHTEMFRDIQAAYSRVAEDIGADIIPSGELFQKLLCSVDKIHRDTYHASYGLGRYALGLLWYSVLTGNEVSGNEFCDFDEPVSPVETELAKSCVKEITSRE